MVPNLSKAAGSRNRFDVSSSSEMVWSPSSTDRVVSRDGERKEYGYFCGGVGKGGRSSSTSIELSISSSPPSERLGLGIPGFLLTSLDDGIDTFSVSVSAASMEVAEGISTRLKAKACRRAMSSSSPSSSSPTLLMLPLLPASSLLEMIFSTSLRSVSFGSAFPALSLWSVPASTAATLLLSSCPDESSPAELDDDDDDDDEEEDEDDDDDPSSSCSLFAPLPITRPRLRLKSSAKLCVPIGPPSLSSSSLSSDDELS
mmetsp:Transcript_5455/g.16060  ORF Transcript_5455/g.16060 Transcript_5455/m.16060 type:complete len:258 (-) Transcript_5455:654-1427(-)